MSPLVQSRRFERGTVRRLGASLWSLAVVCAAASLSRSDLHAEPASRSVAGIWGSNFGQVVFEHEPINGRPVSLTGHWDQSGSARGEVRSGSFDPNTGVVEFEYYQPWNQMTGTARFTLTPDGTQLNGTYTQNGSSGSWNLLLKERASSPANAPPPASRAKRRAVLGSILGAVIEATAGQGQPKAESKQGSKLANQILDALAGKSPGEEAESAEQLAQRAATANNANQPAEALLLANDALRVDSENEMALGEKGRALKLSLRIEDAIAHLEAALRIHPQSAMLHAVAGSCYVTAKQEHLAIEHFAAAAELNPQDVSTLNNLGTLLYRQKKVDAAMRAFDRALAVSPDYFPARRNLGLALLDAGQPDEAAIELTAALAIRPADALTEKRLAQAKLSPAYTGRGTRHRKTLPTMTRTNRETDVLVTASPTTQATLPWRAAVILRKPEGDFFTGTEIPFSYSTSGKAPLLWFGLYASGANDDDTVWRDIAVYDRQSGLIALRAPAIPGDYTLRVFGAAPGESSALGEVEVRVRFGQYADTGSDVAMDDIVEPARMPPASLPSIRPPTISEQSLPTGETEAVAAAIYAFHEEWFAAVDIDPTRTLQLQIESPAISFNLALNRTGSQASSPVEANLPLSFAPARANEIIGDRPVRLRSTRAVSKGLMQYYFQYGLSDMEKASQVLAELLVAAHPLAPPTGRSGRKKTAPTEDSAQVESESSTLPAGLPPWETEQWDKDWPRPRSRPSLPNGIRQYHVHIPSVPGLGNTMDSEYLRLRFDWSRADGLDVNWATRSNAATDLRDISVSIYETAGDLAAGEAATTSPGVEDRPDFPQNSATEAIAQRPSGPANQPGIRSTSIGEEESFQLGGSSETPATASSAQAPTTRSRSTPPPAQASSTESHLVELPVFNGQIQSGKARPWRDRSSAPQGRVKEDANERWRVEEHISSQSNGDTSHVIYHETRQLLARRATRRDPWLDVNEPSETRRHWEMDVSFLPESERFHGQLNIAENGRQQSPIEIDARAYRYGTEFGDEIDNSQPLWISEFSPPAPFLRAGDVVEFPVQISAEGEPPTGWDSDTYQLTLIDSDSGETMIKPLRGSIRWGETEDLQIKLTVPSMTGDWRIKANLTVGDYLSRKDLTVTVGGFPVQIMAGHASPATLVAGQSATVHLKLGNVLPAALQEEAAARGTGGWGIFDHHRGEYMGPSGSTVTQRDTFDLLPGDQDVSVVGVVSPETLEGDWRLSLVMWDLEGRTVGYRDLPPVTVTAPLTEVAAEIARNVSEKAQPPSMDQMVLMETQIRLENLQSDLQELKDEIQRQQKSLHSATDLPAKALSQKKAHLAKYIDRRDSVFSELGKKMAGTLSYLDQRLTQEASSPAAVEALRQARNQVERAAKQIKIDTLFNQNDRNGLVDYARENETKDPVLAAEANKRLGLALLNQPNRGGRREALVALRRSADLNPGDESTRAMVNQLEKSYLKDVHVKLGAEMTEAQRKFEGELGNHGEAGMWGAIYDVATIGIVTSGKQLLSNVGGSESDLDDMTEVVGRIEKQGQAQQAGLVFIRKLVDAGMPMQDVSALELPQLLAVRALATHGLRPGASAVELQQLSPKELRWVTGISPDKLQRAFPALKKLMDSGGVIPDRGLVAALGSMRAAMSNPDIKQLASGQSRQQLAVDHQQSDAFESYLGGESLGMTTSQSVLRNTFDFVNVLNAVSFIPGASLKSGGTAMEAAITQVGRLTPRTADYLRQAHTVRKEMTFFQQMMIDTSLSVGLEYGATKWSGDARVGQLASSMVDLFTGGLDAEGITRKLMAAKIDHVAIRTIKTESRAAIQAASHSTFDLGDLLNDITRKLDAGNGATVLRELQERSVAIRSALADSMPESLRALRQTEKETLDGMLTLLEAGDIQATRRQLAVLASLNSGNNATLSRIKRDLDLLERVENRLAGRAKDSSENLVDDLKSTLQLGELPVAQARLSDLDVDLLLQQPEKLRQFVDAGLIPGGWEQRLAKVHADRIVEARNAALQDLAAQDWEYAQLFHHFRDTGSWTKGKTFRDADMTAKLDSTPSHDLLKSLYAKRGQPDVANRPYEQLLAIYHADLTLKRDVLMSFQSRMGHQLGKLNGHPGSPAQVLKEYDVVLNEIPGPMVGGTRVMSSEEYRLTQAFARTEGWLGDKATPVTRISFNKNGQLNARTGFRVDDVRLPGDVPIKLEPQHALAKVVDEWTMFHDHSHGVTSQWDRVQKVGKYPGRVNDELLFLLSENAPTHLVPAMARDALHKMQTRFKPMMDEWRAIKALAGEIGYAAATEKVLTDRVAKFKGRFPADRFPDLTEAHYREMAAEEYIAECQQYFRAMSSVAKLVPNARGVMASTHQIGGKFTAYFTQNPALVSVIVY